MLAGAWSWRSAVFGAAILATGLTLAACGAPAGEARPEAVGSDVAIPEEERTQVALVGEEAATSLRTGLSARLAAAMAEGGPEAAIDVCAADALPLTDSIAGALGVAVKRTSQRVRNPANAPDAAEQAALDWFASEEAAGRRPESLVERDGSGYRYYSPLRVAAACTTCHGPRESLAAGTLAAVAARYPADEATGYAEGDFRGLIRVTVQAETAAGVR